MYNDSIKHGVLFFHRSTATVNKKKGRVDQRITFHQMVNRFRFVTVLIMYLRNVPISLASTIWDCGKSSESIPVNSIWWPARHFAAAAIFLSLVFVFSSRNFSSIVYEINVRGSLNTDAAQLKHTFCFELEHVWFWLKMMPVMDRNNPRRIGTIFFEGKKAYLRIPLTFQVHFWSLDVVEHEHRTIDVCFCSFLLLFFSAKSLELTRLNSLNKQRLTGLYKLRVEILLEENELEFHLFFSPGLEPEPRSQCIECAKVVFTISKHCVRIDALFL